MIKQKNNYNRILHYFNREINQLYKSPDRNTKPKRNCICKATKNFHTESSNEKNGSRRNRRSNLFDRSGSQSGLTLRLPIHYSPTSGRPSWGSSVGHDNNESSPNIKCDRITKQRMISREREARAEGELGVRVERESRSGGHGRASRDDRAIQWVSEFRLRRQAIKMGLREARSRDAPVYTITQQDCWNVSSL